MSMEERLHYTEYTAFVGKILYNLINHQPIVNNFATLGFSLRHFSFILCYLQTVNGYHTTEVQ